MMKLTIVHSKSRKMGKIVIQGFHVSRKWFEVKSLSRLIHVNFIHDPSLVAKSLPQCEDLTDFALITISAISTLWKACFVLTYAYDYFFFRNVQG